MITREQLLRTPTTPLSAPAFRPGRHRFTDREYFNIQYRTDPDAFAAAVPEPLRVVDPVVRFEIMHMGDVDGFGPYTECGIALGGVELDGERGEFLHAMYLDDFAATAAGREGSAYPKAMGSPRLRTESGALVGTLDIGSIRVATATMVYKQHELTEQRAREIIGAPTWSVKIARGLSGAPFVLELARTRITDLTVRWAYAGQARLQLFDHVLAPLADLPVRGIVHASHVLTDLSLAPFETVHDYLTEPVR